MTAVIIIYILAEPNLALGRFIPYYLANIIGISVTSAIFIFYLVMLFIRKGTVPDEEEQLVTEQVNPVPVKKEAKESRWKRFFTRKRKKK